MRQWLTVRGIAAIVMLCLLMLGAVVDAAYAQGTPSTATPMTTDGRGGKTDCRSLPETQGGSMLGVLVPCIAHSMRIATQNFSAQLIDTLSPLVYIYMTLVLVFFGVKVATGGTQHGGANRIKGEAFVLVFKIGVVIAVLEMIPSYIVPASYSIMTQSQGMVANALITSGVNADCPGSSSVPIGSVGTSPIWIQMDCVLGKLYGFTTGTGGRPNMLLMSSAFGFLGGFFFGGSFGVALFLMCVGALWSLFMLVIRTASAFLHGYLYVCIMYILSPVFMPLVLQKQTQPYFQGWTKGIIGSMLLPVIVSSYSVIALQVYNKVLFEPNSEFQKLFDPEFAKKVQASPRPPLNWQPTGTPEWRATATGKKEAELYGKPMMKNEILPFLSGANSPFGTFSIPALNMTKEQFEKMFYSALRVLVTTLIISEGLQVVMRASTRLTGSLAVGQSMTVQGSIEQRLQSGVQGAQSGLSQAFAKQGGGSASGVEFIEKMKNVPSEVVRGFIGGTSR